MKIIRPGSFPDWWLSHEWHCDNCGCVFVVEKGDETRAVQQPTYTIPSGIQREARCPMCHATVVLTKPNSQAGETGLTFAAINGL